MRRTILLAAAAAGTLSLALAVPAVAAGNGVGQGSGPTSTSTCTGDQDRAGTGQATQHRRGRGGGAGLGAGSGATRTTATLTADQVAEMMAMAEEEKLAGDVYAVLAERLEDAELAAIATSEDRHLDRVRTLMARYGVSDPTAGMGVGEFATGSVATAFADFVEQGSAGLAEAYQVGVVIEETDIADLERILDGTNPRDVTRVYTNLKRASEHHLAAFTS